MVSPLDISSKVFRKSMFGGYNVEEVDVFLDRLMEDYANMFKELSELKESYKKMEETLEDYRSMMEVLKPIVAQLKLKPEEVERLSCNKKLDLA